MRRRIVIGNVRGLAYLHCGVQPANSLDIKNCHHPLEFLCHAEYGLDREDFGNLFTGFHDPERPISTLKAPTDCSWSWRKILKLRTQASRIALHLIGNGNKTGIWETLGIPWHEDEVVWSVSQSGEYEMKATYEPLRHENDK
ncbi:hypothetical protein GIB67_012100, partial [Kingdonia uniflora]